MSLSFVGRHVSPWVLRRDKDRERKVHALRERDGDDCRRCRRSLRFDLPRGHERAPTIERIVPIANGEAETLDNLCLCHGRCNSEPADQTLEVTERIRRRNEAALLGRKRGNRKVSR